MNTAITTTIDAEILESVETLMEKEREAKKEENSPFVFSIKAVPSFVRGDSNTTSTSGVKIPGRVIGHSSVTGPIYGYDGLVISHKQEPLGHSDGERRMLESWGYMQEMMPPETPLDDPQGTPVLTLRYADKDLRGSIERSIFGVGRRINLLDILHLIGKTLPVYCSEPSADRWWQINNAMLEIQAEYKAKGAAYIEEIEATGRVATDTLLADKIMGGEMKKYEDYRRHEAITDELDVEYEAIMDELDVEYNTTFAEVADEIDNVLQSKVKVKE